MKDIETRDRLFEGLELISESDIVIVEGINDVKALENLDVDCTFIPLNKEPLYKIVDKVIEICSRKNQSNSKDRYECRVHLLMDFDTEGQKLYNTLSEQLNRQGVKLFEEFRRFLSKETSVKQIEDLDNYINNLQKRINHGFEEGF